MLGHVCQLHYHGGGVVAYQLENGRLARLQFRTGPFLKIGQEVTLSIVDGAAVDILAADPSKEMAPKHAGGVAGSTDTLVERADYVARPATSQAIALLQSMGAKRLQREIVRFRNATPEERLEWMDQIEVELQRLLEEDGDGLDGDGLCRLVRRLAAWLHRPVVNSPCADHRSAKHWPRGRQDTEMSWKPPGLYPASLADLQVGWGWCAGGARQKDVSCQAPRKRWGLGGSPGHETDQCFGSSQRTPCLQKEAEQIQSLDFRLGCAPLWGDRFDNLHFCPHMRELRTCTGCGGSRICEHQKRRDQCVTCRHLPGHWRWPAQKSRTTALPATKNSTLVFNGRFCSKMLQVSVASGFV